MTTLEHRPGGETAGSAVVDGDRGRPTADATRMSTAPVAVGPSTRGRAPLRRTWRQLTSMRTALLLLFLLALAAVPGGFVPQRTLNPVEVKQYFVDHPTLAPLLDRLSLFDVFAAPWFAAIYLLLFISLVGCLVPRIRLHARALRRPPPAVPATLSRLPVSEQWDTAGSPDEVLDTARAALRRGRWRTVRQAAGLSAEKGYLRETGNLLFHISLVALLVGIATGGMYGFKGTVLVKDGQGFANTVLSYDDIHPGRRFSPAALVPFHFTLQQFRATYTPEGKARTFDADVRWAPSPDAAPRPYDIRVNHPLHVGAAKVYLIGHGYAPHVVVRDRGGNVALDQTVQCLPQNATFVSECTIKVPNAVDAAGKPDQLAFQGSFTPTTAQDPATGRVTSVYPAADNPALTLVAWRGDLGLDSGQTRSIYSLDTSALEPVRAPVQGLQPGQTWNLPGGGSITYESTAQWATFQITQDPGKIIALFAGAGMVLGLLLSLFVRRRRLWVRVRAVPAGTGEHAGRTVVELGGLARTDPESFAAEFTELATRLRTLSGAPASASTDWE